MLHRHDAKCFTPFTQNVSHIEEPKAFTYPFCHQPHQLSLIAANNLQQLLQNHIAKQGRMYGVLVVKDNDGTMGYLSAVSGTVSQHLHQADNNVFVPTIFNGFDSDHFFNRGQIEVNHLNHQISELESCQVFRYLQRAKESDQQAAKLQISAMQQVMVAQKKQRKIKRESLQHQLTNEFLHQNPNQHHVATQQSIQLSRESVENKKQLAQLKEYWQCRINNVSAMLASKQSTIDTLKKARRKLSNQLQKLLFKQYQFLNIEGETKHLLDLFKETNSPKPPAGAGDCAAPKLLQYAFSHHLTPVCMAEFWWGTPPDSEIRKHGHFYPACQSKCLPILTHMLSGMTVESNPLLATPTPHGELKIVYQDEHLVVVNKPAELLSVPGKHIQDSVYNRIKNLFPNATGSLIVHRLDMATSGLLILALNHRAHKQLQLQFIDKTIKKQYVAILDGQLTQKSGTIHLPLITDINDRPRQLVCEENGKRAETRWQVIEHSNNQTRVLLTPITGRTHQLRVHCAHHKGLNMPIVGDSLYGRTADRLHLHAQHLTFCHPITKEELSFNAPCEF